MGLKVRDAMMTKVVTVGEYTTVESAIEILLEKRVSGLPVIDRDNRLIGVVSEMDLLAVLSDFELESKPIGHILTNDVVTVQEDDSLNDVVDKFHAKNVRRFPVVKDERLVGIISRRDVIQLTRSLRQKLQHSSSP